MDSFEHILDLPLRFGPRAVQATLSYTSADPYAVTLTLDDRGRSKTWILARELLRDGRLCRVGDGNVQIFPGAHASRIRIQLTNGDTVATLEASKDLVTAFVVRIYEAVPDGREHEWLQLDRELAELLEEEGSA